MCVCVRCWYVLLVVCVRLPQQNTFVGIGIFKNLYAAVASNVKFNGDYNAVIALAHSTTLCIQSHETWEGARRAHAHTYSINVIFR